MNWQKRYKELKVGDHVRCVTSCHTRSCFGNKDCWRNNMANRILTITNININDYLTRVKNPTGQTCSVPTECLEKII